MADCAGCEENDLKMLDSLNNKYGIVERPELSDEDFLLLKNDMNTLMDENPAWSKDWLSDDLLRRFLRTFETVRETTLKITEYFEWRVVQNVDDINPSDPILKKLLAAHSNIILDDATDRCGRPIMIIRARNHKKTETPEEIFKSAIYYLESLCARCDRTELKEFCMVYDLGGFTSENMDFPLAQKYFKALKDYYPERVGVALIINYPFLIHSVWMVIKLWLTRRLRSKFIFCGREEFNDFVDEASLPLQLFEN